MVTQRFISKRIRLINLALQQVQNKKAVQTKAVRGKIPSALGWHESMCPAKDCTGLTLVEGSLSETTGLSECGLEDEIILSAAGCAWSKSAGGIKGVGHPVFSLQLLFAFVMLVL